MQSGDIMHTNSHCMSSHIQPEQRSNGIKVKTPVWQCRTESDTLLQKPLNVQLFFEMLWFHFIVIIMK